VFPDEFILVDNGESIQVGGIINVHKEMFERHGIDVIYDQTDSALEHPGSRNRVL